MCKGRGKGNESGKDLGNEKKGGKRIRKWGVDKRRRDAEHGKRVEQEGDEDERLQTGRKQGEVGKMW